MSRIFGYWDGRRSIDVGQGGSILRSLRTPACIYSKALDLRPGALVWSGRRSPQVSDCGGCYAVVDGHFYDSPAGNAENDAEKLLLLYRRYGFREALRSINGDFSVALFDRDASTMWLGRDRFGVKPLYYVAEPSDHADVDLHAAADGDDSCRLKGRVAFASRPRPLLHLPGISAEPNPEYLARFAGLHYRYFDNRPTQSPYKDVRQLPAACFLKFHGGLVEVEKYWELVEEEDWSAPEDALANEYRELLLDAVRIRYAVARKPAFTLSGGMDSSSVLASAVRESGAKQHAFSTVYEDSTYDESDEIRTILDATVKEWHPIEIGNPDVLSVVREMVSANDEPVATATWLSHYLLCREAARLGFEGLFGGLGGDELNAGEYEYFIFHFADLKRQGRDADYLNEVDHWANYHDHPIYRKDRERAAQQVAALADLETPGMCLLEQSRYRRYLSALTPEWQARIPAEPIMEHRFSSYLKSRTYQDMSRETAPCCLRAEDRQGTQFGLDNFLPFFDHRLVEFMFRVPGDLKIKDGVTKHLMRKATKGILPESTRTRIKKTGWNAPAHQWFSGKGQRALLDLVQSATFRSRGIYDVDEVDRLMKEHEQILRSQEPKDNHMMFLWQLVNLELWLQDLEATNFESNSVVSGSHAA